MEDPVQDNSTSANGTADNNAAGNNLSDIMGNMTAPSKPEDTTAKGTQTEGKQEEQPAKAPAPAWTSQLPEEMRNNADVMKQLEKFGKIGDLAKSYAELETKLGNTIVKPGKEATAEEVEAFYQKIGKPKSANDYQIGGEEAAAYRDLAYKNNLTVEQAKSIFDSLQSLGNSFLKQQQLDALKYAKATEDALRKEYGNDYSAKLEMCKRGVTTYGGPELGKKLQDSGLLYDPDVVKMFIRLGEQSAEAGSAIKTAPGKTGYKPTSEGGQFKFKGL